MLTKEHIDELLARSGNVVSTEGTKIGSIGQIYVDDENGQPTWVTVKTGLFGSSESFVPLEGARLEGEDAVVPYTRRIKQRRPRVSTWMANWIPQKKTGFTPTTPSAPETKTMLTPTQDY